MPRSGVSQSANGGSQPGDVVEVEIEGIERIQNPVVSEI